MKKLLIGIICCNVNPQRWLVFLETRHLKSLLLNRYEH